MPNNTWFTPYKFPPQMCLSVGPSQGIVYQLSDKAVVKVPFQYPVNTAPFRDEAIEQLHMSLRSLALFKKESAFYDMLSKKPHRNLPRRLHSKQPYVLVLERLTPLKAIWSSYTREMHLRWILQLLEALEGLEKLGYIHGDLTVCNIGVDQNNQLQLFDFGSVRHYGEEDFYEQLLEDHFGLATCIHFLASGIDPVAEANSLAEVRRTSGVLKEGHGVVHEAARDFEEVIQTGWRGVRPAPPFSHVQRAVADIVGHIGTNGVHQLEHPPASSRLAFDDWMVEKETRWMNEEDYRAAWNAEGYETPDDIWT